MSATNRGATRRRNDDYPTPLAAIRSLAAELDPARARGCMWGEPAAGQGAIIAGLWRFLGVEPGRWVWAELMEGRDYVADGLAGHAGEPWDGVPAHRRAVVTNPPYDGDLPQRFVERS
ncbi:MAG TPA: hypothetical protein VKA64_08635, partial [Gammaproteobacteria bacterium]|nr:hypothetical protein [Gammaproteobacteria bacterium]